MQPFVKFCICGILHSCIHKIAYQSFTSHPPLIPGPNAKTIIILYMLTLMIMVQTCTGNTYNDGKIQSLKSS